MENPVNNLQQLENLFNQANSTPERQILLQTLRIMDPKSCEQLEASILRQQIQALDLDELVNMLANQKGIAVDEARKSINTLVFEQLLDKTQIPLFPEAKAVKKVAPPTVLVEAVAPSLPEEPPLQPKAPPSRPVPPSVGPRPNAPRIPPAVILSEPEAVELPEPPAEPRPERGSHPFLPKHLGGEE